jgi:hypothetical protein
VIGSGYFSLDPPDEPPGGIKQLPADKILRWASWLRHNEGAGPEDPDRLWVQLVQIAHRRAVFHRVAEIVGEAQLPESAFFGYLNDTYVDSQCVAIRRVFDPDRRRQSISFRRLMEELRDALEPFGCPGWAANWEHTLTTNEVITDLERLDAAIEPVKETVDKRIAHMDEVAIGRRLTFREIDHAIDSLFAAFRKYEVFLTDATTPDLVPTIQHDWEAIFRQPWLRP